MAAVEKRACFRRPEMLFQEKSLTLSALSDKLRLSVKKELVAFGAALDTAEARIRALDPGSVLKRGYSILRDRAGHPITASVVCAGDAVSVETGDGRIDATVNGVKLNNRKKGSQR